MSSETDRGPRYVTEQGTDGSYLVVDRGANRDQRIAIERLVDEDDANLNATTLSSTEDALEHIEAQREPSTDPFWAEADRLIAGYTDTLNEHHNFNHLLS